VKKDYERFPRLQRPAGASTEILSPFSDTNRDADARAFAALMRHVKEFDGRRHTVIMIQVENEINGRDRSALAAKALAGQVPSQLIDYLQRHKDTLVPEFKKVWETAGFKTSGTWAEVFGTSGAADEIFTAWHYASYTGRIAAAGKAEYPIPMYVNSWGNSFPRGNGSANGAPMSDVLDVWRAGAPDIDMISPDIYDADYAQMLALYTRSGNPLFIPETRGFPPNNLAVRVLYAFGRHDAIGFSPMGIERPATPDPELISAYGVIAQLAPLISKHQGDGTMSAVLLGANGPAQKVKVGDYTLEATYRTPRALPPAPELKPPFPNAAAIFIQAGPDEFYAAGTGLNVKFTPNTPGPPLAGLATVEEGSFVGGRWVRLRYLAGDDTGSQSLMLPRLREDPSNPALAGPSFTGVVHVTLYRFR